MYIHDRNCRHSQFLCPHKLAGRKNSVWFPTGKVEIGAFRTYPADYTPPGAAASEYQPIPLNKIEDFGVHADRYYALEVQIFKTSLDAAIINLLWNKYWVSTIAASPLQSNYNFVGGQLQDVGACQLDLPVPG